jgi:L-alanine-DL-glutamate epimerase-like enolase superfamily enzyme
MGLIKNVKIKGISIPFKEKVEATWSQRNGTTIFLVELTTDQGVVGYGEMVNFFPNEHCLSTLKRMVGEVQGKDVAHTNVIGHRVLYGSGWMRTGHMNDLGAAAWAAFEMAMLDAQAKEAEGNLADLFGGRLTHRVPVVVNLPVSDFEKMAKDADRFVQKGHKNLFVKVAKHNTSVNEDIQMLEEIRAKVGDEIPFHLDVNGAWKISTALMALRKFDEKNINISCLEQPVMEASGLSSLRERTLIPIGVNELLHSPQSVVECALNGIGDVFILDMYEVGGLRTLWYISQFLADANISVVCRAHGGSSLGYIAALQVLSTCNGAPGPHQFYDNDEENDLVQWDPQLENGSIVLPNNSGIGVTPDPEALKEYEDRYKTGEIYTIYANKSNDVIPIFPKY